jgi:hypothetical protein
LGKGGPQQDISGAMTGYAPDVLTFDVVNHCNISELIRLQNGRRNLSVPFDPESGQASLYLQP